MTHVTCRLTAKNRDQLRNPTLGNQAWATFSQLMSSTVASALPTLSHTGAETIYSRVYMRQPQCSVGRSEHTHGNATSIHGDMNYHISLFLAKLDTLYSRREHLTHFHKQNVAVHPVLTVYYQNNVYFVTKLLGKQIWIFYDTIRDAILTCARKPTWLSLIYRTQPTTKKCKNRTTKSRKQICSEITVNSPGNPFSEYLRRRNEGLQWEGFAEKECFMTGVKEWVGGHQIIVSMTVGR